MTIPASNLVNIVPSVLSAGGSGLNLNGVFLTTNTRVPVGSVLSFTSSAAVASYFGASSVEAANAAIYFAGFSNCTTYPTAMLFAQYATVSVPAYLRGGNASGLTLAQLQAISGVLSVTVNGVTATSGTINLSGATSFSNAAALITSGFAYFDGVVTGSIVPETFSVTGSITGNVLTVSNVSSGTIYAGSTISGSSVIGGTSIINQITGTAGGIGTYTVSAVQSVSSETISGAYGELTVTAVTSGALAVGQVISGTGVTVGTTITADISGTGGDGTYVVSVSQTVISETISGGPLTCTFDSVSGAFILTGGTPGTGTIGYASGSLSASLFLTSVTGAVTSQAAPISVPATFMNALRIVTTNWASFTTIFNPDAYGNANKLAFSAWTNSTNNAVAYIAWDTDITPTQSTAATSSLGYLIGQAQYSGTILVYDPSDSYLNAFVAGTIASINYNANNGRITLAYKSQSGQAITVTTATVASNLIANGYNFYGAYATANQQFNFFQNGSISGKYLWADSFINQIWLNNALQLALLNFLANINSVPYNAAGDASIYAVCQGTIQQALSNGVFSPGVNLSAGQIVEVNTAAGANIAGVLSTRGWYLQVLQATPQVRAARTSPPINLWYTDGGSIQQITLASIEVQ